MGSKDQKAKAKKRNASSGVGFVIAVIIGLAVIGNGKGCQPDPEMHRVPPSTPTDVGTIPPGLDK